MATGTSDNTTIRFRYRFRFDDGEEQVIRIALDAKTLARLEPALPGNPEPSMMGFCQSASCPRRNSEQPTCPAVVGLDDVMKVFASHQVKEEVEVSIETDARTYAKRTTLQQGLTSLLGIFMVTSGCAVMSKLKPMVRFHLPFATLEETQYRVISMYLLAQYFVARQGGRPDWKLQDLVAMYKDLQSVNEYFVKRMTQQKKHEDPGINALVLLQAFSYAIAFAVDKDMLEEIELLFKAYVEDTP